jgi:hypothetical protein
MAYHCEVRTTCRFCGSKDLQQYIDLGDQPPSNSFIKAAVIAQEEDFPLRVNLCRACGLSQLTHTVSARDIFDEYAYLSSTSRALVQHYQELVDGLIKQHAPAPGSLVVDIGANDGIMLDRYPAGFRPVGVEPSSAGAAAEKKGHVILRTFFDEPVAEQLVAKHGKAKLATITNVFAHIDEIHTVVRGFAKLMDTDGVLVIEFPYVIDTIDQLFFDTIYHEHLCYLAVSPIARLFATVGMRPFHAKRVAVGASGPAVQLSLCLNDAPHKSDGSVEALLKLEQDWGLTDSARYEGFSKRVQDRGAEIRALLDKLKAEGKTIAAFAAPAKGNTLLNAYGLSTDRLDAISENNAEKVGKVAPGSHIPVITDEDFLARKYDYALLLAWNYADFFVKNAAFVKQGGKFIIPLPNLVIAP